MDLRLAMDLVKRLDFDNIKQKCGLMRDWICGKKKEKEKWPDFLMH